MVVVLLYVLTFPISIRYYAGQATDFPSHLSFILGFIFLELEDDWALGFTVLAGALAKESIALLPVYAFVFEPNRRKSAFVIGALCVLELVGVRALVGHGMFSYQAVSGVDSHFIWQNLADLDEWPRQMMFTVGIFVPFAAVTWSRAPRRITNLLLVLTPGLFLTNALFSWMREARNFVPLSVLLAILTVMAFNACGVGPDSTTADEGPSTA